MKRLIFLFIIFLSLIPVVLAQNIFDAVKSGNQESVKQIVSKNPKVLLEKDDQDNTPLHIAISNEKTDIAKYIIGQDCDINAKSNSGETPLHIAAEKVDTDILSLLVSKKALLDINNNSNYTPLTNVIRNLSVKIDDKKRLAAVKILIEGGADLNKKGMWFLTPIELASEFGKKEIVEYLLEKGADVSIAPGWESAQLISGACSRGIDKLFEKMVEKGYEVKPGPGTNGLLHQAAAGGSEKIIEILLSKGFKVMSGDPYGWSPLHYATEKGKLNIVKLLLEKGADINDKSAAGNTPYSLADYFGHKDVCDFLISKGADKSEQQFPALTGKYLGQKEPGKDPKVFGVDIVTTKNEFHGNICFSPDGNEAYWSGWYPVKGSTETKVQIIGSRLVNGKWSRPELASFSKIGSDDDSPFISPDGNRLFFISRRPVKENSKNSEKENLWFLTKDGENWVNPKPVDIVNSYDIHWQVSLDKKNNLYFGATEPGGKGYGDIYCSEYKNGEFAKPVKLSSIINSENREGSPFISTEGDYILFHRASQQGIQMGIFISFKKNDGQWTEPKLVSEKVKMRQQSQCCRVTPDGKYFFFISGYGAQFGSIWVEASFIEEMKKETLK